MLIIGDISNYKYKKVNKVKIILIYIYIYIKKHVNLR